MKEFSFTLIFTLPKNNQDPAFWAETLGANGCDDALIGIGVTGRIALAFIREAPTAAAAVVSAFADVKATLTSANLVEVTPDLVGLTEVAELLGFSRQYMRKVMVNRPAFPAPVHEGKTAIWHLESILLWLRDNDVTRVPLPLLELSAVTRQCNLQRELSALDITLQKKIGKLL